MPAPLSRTTLPQGPTQQPRATFAAAAASCGPTRVPLRNRGCQRMAALLALLAVALVPAVGTAQADPPAPPAAPSALGPDLAAMVLRASDLETAGLEGFGELRLNRPSPNGHIPTGYMPLAGAVDQSIVGEASSARLSALYVELAEAGWVGQYRGLLGRFAAEIQDVDPVVISSVAEYTTPEGASAALELLTTPNGVEGVSDVDVLGIGDETVAQRDTRGVLFVEDERRTLTFRLGRYLGTVQVDGGGVRSPEVYEAATLEALGQLLAGRIEQAVEQDDPGLAPLVPRMAVPVVPFIDRYDVLGGDVLPYFAEDDEERADRAAGFEGRLDVYRLDQSIPWGDRSLNEVPHYMATLSRFLDEAAAAAYLEAVPARRDLEPLPDVPTFGEQSLAFEERYEWLGVTRLGYRIYARVGALVATVTLDAQTQPPLEAVETLAAEHVRCITGGGCEQPVPVPTAIQDLVCPSVESDDPPTLQDGASVPMARGDAGRTGRQSGSGPAEAPDPAWSLETPGGIGVEVVVGGGLAYVGTGLDEAVHGQDGTLLALDVGSGTLSWCLPTGGFFTGAQAVADGLLVGGHPDQRVRDARGAAIVALDAVTGVERWRVFVSDALGDAVVVDGTVYIGGADGLLRALDLASGTMRWMTQPSDDPQARLLDGVAVAEGVVVAATSDGVLHAIDAATGQEGWRMDDLGGGIGAGPVAAEGIVLVTDANGTLHALDLEDGSRRWSEELGSVHEPALHDGAVVVGAVVEGEDVLLTLDGGDGSVRSRTTLPAPVTAQPALTDGTVFVMDEAGALHALAGTDGTERWAIQAGDAGSQPPVVVDGLVLVASEEGSLITLGGPGGG
jgi:outer membrane protein assembly factor BamB